MAGPTPIIRQSLVGGGDAPPAATLEDLSNQRF